VIGAITGAVSRFLYRPIAREQPVSSLLRLTVRPEDSSLHLRWDPNATAVRDAAHAILHIQDGDYESDRDLAPSDLNLEDIVYQPKATRVSSRFDLYPVRPNATGAIEVVNYRSISSIPATLAEQDHWPRSSNPSPSFVKTVANRFISVDYQNPMTGGGRSGWHG
jgi:hypothetical protein